MKIKFYIWILLFIFIILIFPKSCGPIIPSKVLKYTCVGIETPLIGLIQMLGALDNPATVGPAMALALVTTLYGAVLANMLFLPVAGKLRNRHEEEAVLKVITLEGVIALSKQENPIAVEQRLQSFAPLASAA